MKSVSEFDSEFPLVERQKFRCPSIILILGQTGSGKSFFTRQLLVRWEEFFAEPFDRLTLCVRTEQEEISQLIRALPENIEVIKRRGELRPEFIDVDKLASPLPNGHAVVVIDDHIQTLIAAKQGSELGEKFVNLIVLGSHHRRVSVVLTLQAASFGSHLLSVALANTNLVVLSWREATLFQSILIALQRQIFPGAARNFLSRLVSFIRKNKHSHLLIDAPRQEVFVDMFSEIPLKVINLEGWQ